MNRWSMVTGGKRMAVMAMILAVTVCGSGCAGTAGNNASEEGVTVGQSQADADTGGNDNQTSSTAGKGGSQAEGGAGENGNQADTGAGENGKQTGGTAGKSGSQADTAAEGSGKQTADNGAGKEASSNTIFAFKNREMADEALVKECEEFVSLMEGYVESRFSVSAGDGQTEELEKLLSGHYEVAGRKAEDGREYYMAVRRSDAPAYEDFHEMSVSYVSYSGSTKEITQIGYDNRAGRETVLYEITDYLVMLLKDRQNAMMNL